MLKAWVILILKWLTYRIQSEIDLNTFWQDTFSLQSEVTFAFHFCFMWMYPKKLKTYRLYNHIYRIILPRDHWVGRCVLLVFCSQLSVRPLPLLRADKKNVLTKRRFCNSKNKTQFKRIVFTSIWSLIFSTMTENSCNEFYSKQFLISKYFVSR